MLLVGVDWSGPASTIDGLRLACACAKRAAHEVSGKHRGCVLTCACDEDVASTLTNRAISHACSEIPNSAPLNTRFSATPADLL